MGTEAHGFETWGMQEEEEQEKETEKEEERTF